MISRAIAGQCIGRLRVLQSHVSRHLDGNATHIDLSLAIG